MTFEYDRLGRQMTITDAVGTRTFTYRDDPEDPDAHDLQLVSETLDADTLSPPYTLLVNRVYQGDDTNEVPGRAGGFFIGPDDDVQNAEYTVAYHYDAAGRFERITGPGLPGHGVQYTWLSNGPMVDKHEFKSDSSTVLVRADYSYNAYRDLVTAVDNARVAATAETISKYEYVNDAVGRRTSVVNTGAAFSQSAFSVWHYNTRSELTGSWRGEGATVQDPPTTEVTAERRLYNYDPIGNRIDSTEGTGGAKYYCANSVNQYKFTDDAASTCPTPSTPTEEFDYDADGNLIEDGQFTYTWDGENRLIEVVTRVELGQDPEENDPGDWKLLFAYDYQGRRVRKRSYLNTGNWTITGDWRFVYDGWNVVLVLDGLSSNDIQTRYTWGLDLSGQRGNSTASGIHGAGGIGGLLAVDEMHGPHTGSYWFLYDANGNVGQIVENTTNYPVAAHYEYDAYGKVLGTPTGYAADNVFRFSTKWRDAETGLCYYGHRYYEPKSGRWLSRDPIGEIGGQNLYGFGRNDLVNTVDPHRLLIESIWDVASIVYDVGKITIGVVVNNPQLVADGTVDLATDTVALLIPGVPAGASKFVRVFRSGKAAREALENGTDVVIKLRKSRKVSQVNNTRAVAGQELQHYVTDIFKEDVVGTNIKITVKTCTGKTVTAELDVIIKETAYELKNWGTISPAQAQKMAAQIVRQTDVVKAFKGKHGGVIIGDHTKISGAALQVFEQRGIPVWNVVEGKLTAVVSVK